MAEIAQTFALNPYAAEAQKLERQRKYAEILQAQGLQPEGKHSYAGIEAPPSAAGALAKGLQLGISGFMQGRADRKYDDLIGRATAGRKSVMDKVVAALQGTEAVPEVPGSVAATEADVQDREMGINMGTGAAPMTMGQQIPTQGGMGEGPNVGAPPQAAVPGSMEAANALMIGSEFPDLQAAGLGNMNSMALEAKKLKNAITLKAAPGGPNSPTGRPGTAIQYYAKLKELEEEFPPVNGVDHPNVAQFKVLIREQELQRLGSSVAPVSNTTGEMIGTGTPITVSPDQTPEATAARKAAEVNVTTAAATAERNRKNDLTFKTFEARLDNLVESLDKTTTNPVVGNFPALTADAQTAEGAEAMMAPLLKDLFRQAGEGTFTKDDQAILMAMVPKRTDHPEARKAKKSMISQLVRSKLGMAAGGGGKRPDNISEAEWNAMTPKERALWK